VTGAEGITRTRVETSHRRQLMTVFGQVTVARMAYRAPGAANLHPADAALNLPEEKHSHGLRKLAAIESARGSFGSAAAAITRATGTTWASARSKSLPGGPPRTWTRFMLHAGLAHGPMTGYWC
jgi:hypothetical protein